MQTGFHPLDYLVLVLYLGGVVGLGYYFSRQESSTERFFLGNRGMAWWAVGVSIFATQLSAITYIAIPGRAFETDWSWLILNLGIPVAAAIVIFYLLPVFRAREITTIYEWLEYRFGPETRAYGAFAFLLMQAGRAAIILFLPALALAEATGLPVMQTIFIMGVLVTLYTVMGGIEVVIWTDVIQAVVLLAGALLTVSLIAARLDGGLAGIVELGIEHRKFDMVHTDPAVSSDLIWWMLMGAIFTQLVPYASDQTVAQRYFTTRTESEARRCLWLGAGIAIPATLLFFFVGSSLFAYYHAHPELLAAGVEWDRIYPFFIVRELPIGVSGLVIAAIFAGTMSSLDSSLNSISTVCINDFYRRYIRPSASDRTCLTLARWIVVIAGALSTLLALWVADILTASPDQSGAWELFVALQGLLGGGLAGVFLAGALTRRSNQAGVIAALVISTAVIAVVKYEVNGHAQTFAAAGIISAFAVCWLFSYIAQRRDSPSEAV